MHSTSLILATCLALSAVITATRRRGAPAPGGGYQRPQFSGFWHAGPGGQQAELCHPIHYVQPADLPGAIPGRFWQFGVAGPVWRHRALSLAGALAEEKLIKRAANALFQNGVFCVTFLS